MISYPYGIGDVGIRVIEEGSGDRVALLLHGVGARADRWRHNVDDAFRALFCHCSTQRIATLCRPMHAAAACLDIRMKGLPYGLGCAAPIRIDGRLESSVRGRARPVPERRFWPHDRAPGSLPAKSRGTFIRKAV